MITPKTHSRRLILALGILALAACVDSQDPTALPSPPEASGVDAAAVLSPATDAPPETFAFLPPLDRTGQPEGEFDADRRPAVEICPDSSCAEVLVRFTSEGGGVETNVDGEHFEARWSPRDTGFPDGGHFHVRVVENGVVEGGLDVVVGAAARGPATDQAAVRIPGQNVRIRFWMGAAEDRRIGPEGGVVTSADGRVVLVIPEGALEERVLVNIKPSHMEPEDPGIIDALAYAFTPSGLEFLLPADLTITFEDAVPSGFEPEELRVLKRGENAWAQLPGSVVSAEEGTVNVVLHGFSDHAVGQAQVADITVEPAAVELAPGESVQLVATVTDIDGSSLNREVEWTSGDTQVAVPDEEGQATGVSAGMTFIEAGADGVSGMAEVTVLADDPVAASIIVTPSESQLEPGEGLQLNAVVLNASGQVVPDATVTWSSEDPCVASVDEAGWVHAYSGGESLIRATSGDATGEATVAIPAAPEGTPATVDGTWRGCLLPRSASEGVVHFITLELTEDPDSDAVTGTATEPWGTDGPIPARGFWRNGSLEVSWAIRFQGGERSQAIFDARPGDQETLFGTHIDARSGQNFPVRLVRIHP
jgi:hypothetical protein